MNHPPAQLDGANVLCFVFLQAAHAIPPAPVRPNESVPLSATPMQRHAPRLLIQHYLADGQRMGAVPALACGCYSDDDQVYLFYCTDSWEVIQDDVFDSLAEALEQASTQYPGLTSSDWQQMN